MENTQKNSIPSGRQVDRAQKQATGKQLIAIVFILSLATKIFLLPIFLIRATGRDGYIVMSIYSGVDLVMLAVMLIALGVSDDDFFTLLAKTVGRAGARIIFGVLALFLFFKLNTAIAEILAFYGANVFTDFDTSLMLIVLLIFLVAAGAKSLRALCRLNELIVPLIVLCMGVLIMIVVFTSFDLANIFPAVRARGKFFEATVNHAGWLGDFTPLVLFAGSTKTKKHSLAFAAGAGIIGSAVAVFFGLVLSAAFGNVPHLVDNTTNLSSILQYSIGNVYGRIDMLSSIVWSVSVFMETALFSYATARCLGYAIGKERMFLLSLFVGVATYFVQVFALTDPLTFSAVAASPVTSGVALGFTVIIPVLWLACAIKQGGKKHDGAA